MFIKEDDDDNENDGDEKEEQDISCISATHSGTKGGPFFITN